MINSTTFLPVASIWRIRRRASRRMVELKPPARPRSEVATTRRCVSSLPVPRSSGGAPGRPAIRLAREPSTRSIRCAYGRAASTCSTARRSLEAATTFIAEVIFWVDLTLRMRLRRSFRLGIRQAPRSSGEGSDDAVEKFAEALLDLGRDLARGTDRLEEFRVRGSEVGQHRGFEAADI